MDYITPGIKLVAPFRKSNEDPELQKRIFGVTSGHKLPPLLKSLGMTVEAILAVPELLVCGTVITPACIQGNLEIYLHSTRTDPFSPIPSS